MLTFGIAFSSSLRACLGAIRSSVLTDILLNSSSHWARISWAFWIRASVVSRQAGLKFCKWAEMASAANFASPQIPMSISVIVNWTIWENHQLYVLLFKEVGIGSQWTIKLTFLWKWAGTYLVLRFIFSSDVTVIINMFKEKKIIDIVLTLLSN